MEIRSTDTPSRELLLLADESEASVADYLPRSRCYAAFADGQIVGHTCCCTHAPSRPKW